MLHFSHMRTPDSRKRTTTASVVQTRHPLLAKLNARQREAVLTTDGPVLIIAGAGSGKTRTLTHRIAYLMAEREIPHDEILAVTFTNKAAREMRERITALIARRQGTPTVGTFHGFCARILRQYGGHVGVPPTFTIYDEDDASSLMKSVITDAGLSPKTLSPASVLGAIGRWKDELQTPRDIQQAAESAWDARLAGLWETYDQRLREHAAVDFDSLLSLMALLLRTREDVRATLERQYRYLSVDEYQDTNNSQAVLLRLLAGTTRNICAVGDDAQAIYGWRGSRIENIRAFPDQFPGCRTITLEQNYRSTAMILRAANALIQESTEMFPKTLWTENAEGHPPRLLIAEDEQSEGRLILRSFHRLFRAGPYRPADAAILYRTNAQSRALEEACLHAGIPYEIIGGLTFYERKEVKDIVAYLRFIQNPLDERAFRRLANVPTRGVGERTVELLLADARRRSTHPLDHAVLEGVPEMRRAGLRELATIIDELRRTQESTPPVTLLNTLLKKTAFRRWLHDEELRIHGKPDPAENRYANVLELRTVAERHKTLAGFLEELSLMSDAEKTSRVREKRDRMKLMTIHAAKGLEFSLVAVAGMEEGLLPHQHALSTPRGLEEERRLCYVAMTRAREHLLLSFARTRRIYGASTETSPSRFLDDLPLKDGETDTPGSAPLEDEESSNREEADALCTVPGDRVRHTHFGEGVVERVEGTLMTVRFARGVKLLDGTRAPLSPLDPKE